MTLSTAALFIPFDLWSTVFAVPKKHQLVNDSAARLATILFSLCFKTGAIFRGFRSRSLASNDGDKKTFKIFLQHQVDKFFFQRHHSSQFCCNLNRGRFFKRPHPQQSWNEPRIGIGCPGPINELTHKRSLDEPWMSLDFRKLWYGQAQFTKSSRFRLEQKTSS